MTAACTSTPVGTLSEARPHSRRLRSVALELEGGQRVVVPPRSPLRVGKGPDIDLALDDRYVSGRHATVRMARDGVVVQDLGSKNGTYVDGVFVDRAWAKLGAVLRFGRVNARVVSGAKPVVGREEPADQCIVGNSPAFRSVIDKLRRMARIRSPVLLRGETGTGKEVAARIVHRNSVRRSRPFVPINCGAIPESLAESELFGHVRGAFTGAHRDHRGAFSRADGGTLLLDEVAELPPLIQAKLLRVLETGRILPVGAEEELSVDVRVVAATHRDLEAMITTGELREDLYHRLGVLTLELPPLRERREDIPILLEHFARRATADLGYPVELTEAAVTAATRHAWPGNIRALRNAVLRAGAMGEGVIQPQSLVPRPTPPPELLPPGHIVIPRGDFHSMRNAILERVIDEEGSIRRAAKVLGVPRTTLGNWLRRG